jgi:hypothetical protein
VRCVTQSVTAERQAQRAKQMSRDARLLSRALVVVELLLGTLGQRRANDAGIGGLLHSVIAPALTHAYPRVRAPAMRVLALHALHAGVDEARAQLRLLTRALAHDRRRVQCDALRAVFDLVCVHGDYARRKLFDVDDQQETDVDNEQRVTSKLVYARLLAFLESRHMDLCVIAVEGCACAVC